MPLKTFLTRHRRVLGQALIATMVTTLLALNSPLLAHGETKDCTPDRVQDWKQSITQTSFETSPDYILRVTESFLRICKEQPETQEAHRIAAMAAVDLGRARLALEYFELAGPLKEPQDRFYRMSALIAAGRPQAGWAERDAAIADWWKGLQTQRGVKLERSVVRGGSIYRVIFATPLPMSGVEVIWLAQPEGEGWPATLSVGAEAQLERVRPIASGGLVSNPYHVALYRCEGRRLLARQEGPAQIELLEVSAQAALTAYLARPDPFDRTTIGGRLQTCLWPERFLPTP